MRSVACPLSSRCVLMHAMSASMLSRSSEFLLAIDKHLLESMKQEDAMQRLDSGQATERIELKPITFERRD